MKNISRRTFLKTGSKFAVSTSLFLSGYSKSFASSHTEKKVTGNNKALVYLILGGGNDSYNMLVPTDRSSYETYKQSRSNLALSKNSLLRLKGFKDKNNKTFGLHPAMPEVQELFNSKKLSFIANIGPMLDKTTKKDYENGSSKIPLGLLSHADQFRHWQTALPNRRTNVGWFGRCADQMQVSKDKEQISMNISLSGTNILQLGKEAREYSITKDGSVGLIINEKKSALNQEIFKSFNNVLNRDYSNEFDKTYIHVLKEAQTHHERFKQAVQNIDVKTAFSQSELSKQFKMVAKSIAASDDLNMPNQTFFLHYYGWDHHDELLDKHEKMLRVVSKALGEFNEVIDELNLQDRVITFTGSDFGRTLTSNGNGTDHGWGGNVMVMGADVNGGNIYGEYPDLKLDSELDIGGGVLIPTTSIDEMFAELALWFGIEQKNLDSILPNIKKFYDLNSKEKPLGFIG